MNIIDYTVITGNPKADFIEQVKKEILDGWTPIGGVSFLQIDFPKKDNPTMIGIAYSQALVKYNE